MKYGKETSIAVVGVSSDEQKYGHRIFRDLLKAGYNVVPVNPKGEDILEQRVYKTLSEIEKTIELVIMVVPPQVGIEVVKQCVELGITDVWLQPGSQSDEIIKYAQENKINLTHTICFMVEQGVW